MYKTTEKFYCGPNREDCVLNQAVIFGFWQVSAFKHSFSREAQSRFRHLLSVIHISGHLFSEITARIPHWKHHDNPVAIYLGMEIPSIASRTGVFWLAQELLTHLGSCL